MKRLLLIPLFCVAITASAAPNNISPPERRIYVNRVGDVLEWQPGLGIVVVKPSRTVTRVTTRRAVTSDGKAVVETERAVRVERREEPIPLEPRRANDRANDEGENLLEQIEKPTVIPR